MLCCPKTPRVCDVRGGVSVGVGLCEDGGVRLPEGSAGLLPPRGPVGGSDAVTADTAERPKTRGPPQSGGLRTAAEGGETLRVAGRGDAASAHVSLLPLKPVSVSSALIFALSAQTGGRLHPAVGQTDHKPLPKVLPQIRRGPRSLTCLIPLLGVPTPNPGVPRPG